MTAENGPRIRVTGDLAHLFPRGIFPILVVHSGKETAEDTIAYEAVKAKFGQFVTIVQRTGNDPDEDYIPRLHIGVRWVHGAKAIISRLSEFSLSVNLQINRQRPVAA